MYGEFPKGPTSLNTTEYLICTLLDSPHISGLDISMKNCTLDFVTQGRKKVIEKEETELGNEPLPRPD